MGLIARAGDANVAAFGTVLSWKRLVAALGQVIIPADAFASINGVAAVNWEAKPDLQRWL